MIFAIISVQSFWNSSLVSALSIPCSFCLSWVVSADWTTFVSDGCSGSGFFAPSSESLSESESVSESLESSLSDYSSKPPIEYRKVSSGRFPDSTKLLSSHTLKGHGYVNFVSVIYDSCLTMSLGDLQSFNDKKRFFTAHLLQRYLIIWLIDRSFYDLLVGLSKVVNCRSGFAACRFGKLQT
jgi:hypothetical protein